MLCPCCAGPCLPSDTLACAVLCCAVLCRLSTVRYADMTVVMDKGRVAEVGSHSQLIARGGIYAALVRRQSGKMLEQDRDLAPHEIPGKQSKHGPGGDGGPDTAQGSHGGSFSGSMDQEVAAGAAMHAGQNPGPDGLPQLQGGSRPAGIASRHSDEPQ